MQGVRWTEDDLAAFQAKRAGHKPAPAARPVAGVSTHEIHKGPLPGSPGDEGIVVGRIASGPPTPSAPHAGRGLQRQDGQAPSAPFTAKAERSTGTGGGGTDTRPSRRRTGAPLKRPEQALQKAQVAFLDWALMAPWRFLHIPNGGFRTPAEAGLMKALGQKEGAADLLFLGPPGLVAWPFVWIENKAPKGRLSAAQEDWRDWCQSIGAPWFLCRSMDDLVAACADAGVPLRGRPQ